MIPKFMETLYEATYPIERNFKKAIDLCIGLVECTERKADIYSFAKVLGIKIIPNSQFSKKYPPFALKRGKGKWKVESQGESKIFHDDESGSFYIVIDDALSRGTQREIIAYDIARIILEYQDCFAMFGEWTPEQEERRDAFVSYLLGFLELEEEPETPDELVIEVGKV